MQKIILSDKTLGLLIGRLKNFFAGDVIENKYDDILSPTKVAKLPFNFLADHWWIAMVTRHWIMNDTLRVRKGQPRPMIHVSHAVDCATFFTEGDEFYFFGNRNIVVRRVNSSTIWDTEGNNIPTISRFVLIRSRHKISSHETDIKNQSLEDAHQWNLMMDKDNFQELDADVSVTGRTRREIGFTGDFMTVDDLG